MTVGPPVLATAAGPAGELYQRALLGLIELFGVCGEQHWAQRMRQDLDTWRADRTTGHHRQARGGLGSLDDWWYTDDPWLDAAISQLINASTAAATSAEVDRDRFIQITASGGLGSLVWYRCLACGSGCVPPDCADSGAAAGWATWVVPRRLTDCYDGPWWPVGETGAPYARHVEDRITELGLTRHDIGLRDAPCPSCGRAEWQRTTASVF